MKLTEKSYPVTLMLLLIRFLY